MNSREARQIVIVIYQLKSCLQIPSGKSFLDYIDELPSLSRSVDGPVRVPISDKYKVRLLVLTEAQLTAAAHVIHRWHWCVYDNLQHLGKLNVICVEQFVLYRVH